MAAALRIVDRRGLDALTMRGAWEALGYEAMSLYKHVPGKQALLDFVIERVGSEMRPPDASASWDDQLRQLAGEWRVALADPHVFPLLATGPPPSPAALLPIIEATLAALREPAVDDQSATSLFWAFLLPTRPGRSWLSVRRRSCHGTSAVPTLPRRRRPVPPPRRARPPLAAPHFATEYDEVSKMFIASAAGGAR